jgi:hypothetical protein
MHLTNFYVLVDTETKQIINKIQKLPENWKNIAGLPGLSDEELCDLKWAGQHNYGWINIHSEKIKEYFPQKYGWVLQQFLTIEQVINSQFAGVLQINSDTLILKPVLWLDYDENQPLFVSSEYNSNDFFRKGLDKDSY